MKYRQVTEREGEYLGPVDWNYDFIKHFDNYGTNAEGKKALCDLAVRRLKEMSEGGEWFFSHTGMVGFPVVNVGMYDGWHYWRPIPAFSYIGPLDSLEWAFFDDLAIHEPYQRSLNEGHQG